MNDFILLLPVYRNRLLASPVAVGDRQSAMAKSVKLSLLFLPFGRNKGMRKTKTTRKVGGPSPAHLSPAVDGPIYKKYYLGSCFVFLPIIAAVSSSILLLLLRRRRRAASLSAKMADALDMSLDDLITKNKSSSQTQNRRGRRNPASASASGGPAPTGRRFQARAAAAPYHQLNFRQQVW